MITIGAATSLYTVGIYFPSDILELMTGLFRLDQTLIENPNSMQASFLRAFVDLLYLVSPVVIITIIMAISANYLFGGVGFSIKAFTERTEN